MLTATIEFEDEFDDGCSSRIDLNRASCRIVSIAKRRSPRIKSLFSLLPHALLHFFFQIFHVVLCDRHMDVMYELVL